MSKEQKSKDSTVISIRAERALKESIREKAALRDQSISEAAEQMLRYGMPIYLKRVRKKFERVEAA